MVNEEFGSIFLCNLPIKKNTPGETSIGFLLDNVFYFTSYTLYIDY